MFFLDLVSEIRQAAQTREDALLTTIHAKIDALAANHTKVCLQI